MITVEASLKKIALFSLSALVILSMTLISGCGKKDEEVGYGGEVRTNAQGAADVAAGKKPGGGKGLTPSID